MRRSSFAVAALVLSLSPFVAPVRGQSSADDPSSSFPIPESPPTVGSNVQIGADNDVVSVSLDWEEANGDLFAALLRANGDLRLMRSTDAGATWTSPATVTDDATALDSVVVGDHLYLVYAVGSEARLRRASSTTGALDDSYSGDGVQTIRDVTPATVQEVAIISNADTADDTFWCFLLSSDSKIHAYFGGPDSEALTYVATDVAEAASGLSAAWNAGYDIDPPSHRYLMFSYVTTSNAVNVVKRHATLGEWQASNMYWSGGAAEETSISAYRDHVVVTWELADVSGDQDAALMTSDDGGYGWSVVPYFSADLEGGDFYHPLVSSRSGTGTAFALLQETGATDTISLRSRCNYSVTAWSAPTVLNDVSSPAEDTRRGNDFDWLGGGWGLGYVDELGQAWFTWSESIRYSGFECAGLDEWSNSVGGP